MLNLSIKNQISIGYLGLFQKKIPGGGRRQAIYFSMGGRCAHFSNYMGPWCLTNSDYIGGGVRPISNSVGGCIAFAASRRGKPRRIIERATVYR